jgi:hypothetical protein
MSVCMQMTNLSLFVRRLKINHKSLGSYTFILEDGTATNNYLSPPQQMITKNEK